MGRLSRVIRCTAVVALAAAICARAALADEPPESSEALLQHIFDGGAIDAGWISPAARSQLTPELIAYVVGDVRATAGTLRAIEPEGDRWRLTFDEWITTVSLTRDENGLLAGLLIGEPIPLGLTLDQAVSALAELPGETALLVTAGGEVLAERNADAELLVASTFKLAVLQALRDSVDAGALAWDQVVRLDRAQASVSSGVLRAYPDGHPITVATLAAMMISDSDNTATDVLIGLVGRERVEAAAGNAPLLDTGEYFKLKVDAGLYRRYLDATPAERRQIIEELADVPLPRIGALANGRTAHGWRLSARRLCALMAEVADLDLMTINTGGIAPSDWRRIAFKGGNDVGVTNLTYMLTPSEGLPICVSLTWNEPGHYDDVGFNGLVNRLLHVLRSSG